MSVTKAQIDAAVELAKSNFKQWEIMSALVAPKIREAVTYELEQDRLAKAGEVILDHCIDSEFRGDTFEDDLKVFTEDLARIAVSVVKVASGKESGEPGRGAGRFFTRQVKLVPVAGGEVTIIHRRPV